MTLDHKMGEWSDRIQAFWFGGNGCEFIAWKGSHHIFVYPSWEHPDMPSQLIIYSKRIETLEEFDDALINGKQVKAYYEELIVSETDNPSE